MLSIPSTTKVILTVSSTDGKKVLVVMSSRVSLPSQGSFAQVAPTHGAHRAFISCLSGIANIATFKDAN